MILNIPVIADEAAMDLDNAGQATLTFQSLCPVQSRSYKASTVQYEYAAIRSSAQAKDIWLAYSPVAINYVRYLTGL